MTANKVFNLITAILYPAILIVVDIVVFFNGGIELTRAILIAALSLVMSICIILGGVYLLIIPLPYISLYKWGSCNDSISFLRKFICSVFAILFGIGAIVLLTL